jgi:hypothetical protein
LLALGAGLVWVATQQTMKTATDTTVQPVQDNSAVLHLQIKPDVHAITTIDGKVIGNGVQVIHANLIVGREFELKVTADGYQTFTEHYTASHLERLLLPITMLPLPPEPPPEPVRVVKTVPTPKIEVKQPAVTQQPATPGKLNVNVRGGWAEVYIDGRRVDTTPLYHHPLSAGPHTIEIVHGASGERQSRQITIFPNQTSRITF